MDITKDYIFKSQKQQGFHLDPRSKILFMVYMSVLLVVFGSDIIMVMLLSSIPFCLLLQNRQFKIAISYGTLFLLGIIAAYFHSYWTLSPVPNAIVMLLIALVLRLFPTFMLGYYIIKSTSVRDFIGAMKKWRVSDKFIIPVSVLFRFLPTIKEESDAIKKAMKMRGIHFGSFYSLKHPGLYIEYRIIPLIISIAKIGEELSAAALTRGLGVDVKRSTISLIKFSIYDYFLCMLSLGIISFGIYRRMGF